MALTGQLLALQSPRLLWVIDSECVEAVLVADLCLCEPSSPDRHSWAEEGSVPSTLRPSLPRGSGAMHKHGQGRYMETGLCRRLQTEHFKCFKYSLI